ncbi:hypothetical protein GJ633_03655 [Halorubrum sp. CBA1125]|uniref:hypothetical protein n=1 Tax=Halorubrum sp. CBA1125 TaxID=2668072 RepID=UPI0012E7D312|nr:hypothetical protein [Halorubrum sp. CBA1125]MUW13859.1 hypothetical protein [Halorubrum sp. CBA1125]
MTEQPVDVEPAGQNVAGETPAAEPEAVTDETTVHDDVEAVPETEAGRASRRPTGAAHSDRGITLRERESQQAITPIP